MPDPSDKKEVSSGVEDEKRRDDEVRAFFNDLYQRMGRTLQVRAYRLLGNWHQAEDAVQEAFYAALKRESIRHDVRSHPNIDGFMQRVLQNTVYNMRSRQAAASNLLAELEAHAIEQGSLSEISHSFWDLDEFCKQVLLHEEYMLLKEISIDGGSFSELAQRTGTNIWTLRKRHERLLKKLRTMLREEFL